MRHLGGTTKIIGILGNPVGHSLSPAMHNAAIAASDLDYVYVPFAVTPELLGQAVCGLRALGVSGFNVTIPHKTAVMEFLDELDETASAAGAVNTVLVKNGRMTGYNTDGDGLICSLADDLRYVPASGTIIIIGAGGAARGAVAALCRNGAGRIVVVNRSVGKAMKLADEMTARYPDTTIQVSSQEELCEKHFNSAELLVNTTSLGMNNEKIGCIDLVKLPKSAKIYDMVYSPAETPLLIEAAELGIAAVNGLGMLAAQGELAFKIWTGKAPPQGLMMSVLKSICHD